jgi:hypothetical protein
VVPEHGDVLERQLLLGGQGVEAGGQQRLERDRDRPRGGQPVPAVLGHELAPLARQGQELTEVEGVPARPLHEEGGGLVGEGQVGDDGVGHHAGLVVAQGAEPQVGGGREVGEPARRLGPTDEHEHDRQVAEPQGQLLHHLEAPVPRPMHVVEHEQDRLLRRLVLEQPAVGPELLGPEGGGVDLAQGGVDVAGGGADAGVHVVVAHGAELAGDLGGDPGPADRPVGGVGRVDDVRLVGHLGAQLLDQARRPHPRLAGDEHHRGAPLPGRPVPEGAEEGEVVLPAHQRRAGGIHGVVADAPEGHGLAHVHGVALALEHDGLALAVADTVGGELSRERADQHFAGTRRLLEAGGDVDGVADDRQLAAGERGDHDLAGVDADREGQVAPDLPHGQPRRHRPLGVVVVGGGHAEHGQQRVAHVLVDGAAVVGDHRGQAPEGGVDRPGDGLGVGPLGQRGEAHHVGEQDGGQLALVDRRRDGRSAQRRAALAAEPRGAGVGRPARRARRALEGGAARAAEPRRRRVLRPARPARPHTPILPRAAVACDREPSRGAEAMVRPATLCARTAS